MKKCITVLGDNFNSLRTGRANPAILDRIMVCEQQQETSADSYGS